MSKKLLLANSLINHIVFVLDESASMGNNTEEVIAVFDSQVKYLAQRSQELDQETRVSVYTFSNTVDCLIYDKDVMRLPSLRGIYQPNGMTALLDGAGKAITDLEKTATLYGDHAFLVYVLTDGQENRSIYFSKASLKNKIDGLRDNWTVAVLVPDKAGALEAQRFGFPANNTSIWEVDKRGGVIEVGETMRKATDTYMVSRASGVRGTKNLFALNTNVSSTEVKKKLEQISPADYEILIVRQKSVIKPFVESWTKQPYRQGSAYYQLTKTETIQPQKAVLIREQKTGKVFGGDAARTMLGLPKTEVKVQAAHLAGYDIFIQSTAPNRNLMPNTDLIVLK